MLNKYKTEFEEMQKRIGQNENPLDVARDYVQIFEKEGIGPLGILSYLSEYKRG